MELKITKSFKIEKKLEPKEVLRTPENRTKTLYKQLQSKKIEYETWCRHTD